MTDVPAPKVFPTLYSFRRCPYAMRARLALAVSRQKCALREIVLRDKPAEMIALSPKASVPVLHLTDGRVIDESLDIMLWALNRNDPAKWLEAQNGSLPEMMALIAESDGPFKHHLDRYKYAVRYEAGTDPLYHRAEGAAFLRALDDRLLGKGQLFGAHPALADIALFPFVRQFANTDRAWFDAQPWSTLHTWLDGHLASDQFRRVMQKWPVWAPGNEEPVFPA